MIETFLTRYNPIKHLNMRLKLIITYTLIIFGIIFGLQRVNYLYSKKIITNNAIIYSQLIIDKISSNIDTIVDEMDRITQTILIEEELIRTLALLRTNSEQDIQEYNGIQTFMNRILGYRRDIDRLMIANNNGKLFTTGPNNYVPAGYDMKSESWYSRFSTSDQLMLFIPPHRDSFSYYDVFSVVRKIRTYSSKEVVGLIRVDLRVSVLDGIWKQGGLDESSIILFDSRHHPVYHEGVRLTREELEEIGQGLDTRKGIMKIGMAQNSKIISYVKSMDTGLYAVFVVPEKVLFKDMKVVNTFTNIMTIGGCVVALMLSIANSIANTRSVEKLLGGMKQLENGHLDTVVQVKSRDEIATVAAGLNHMVEKIKILMKQKMEMEVKKKEAEMLILQGQINPHFLYNTLDGIRMKAIINHDDEAASMIEELSQLLRATTNIRQEMVPLEEELDYISRYIKLQNGRFREKFEMTIAIPAAQRRMIVPKFILQPVIENAVHHGLEAKKSDRKIWITTVMELKGIAILVRDNGIGISKERLEKIRNSFVAGEEESGESLGIGLQNINRRLRLYYGEDYGLTLESPADGGTLVRLLFPSET